MKAEINEHGALIVTAESGIESFALRRLAGELIEPVGVGGGCYPATKIIINHQLENGHGLPTTL